MTAGMDGAFPSQTRMDVDVLAGAVAFRNLLAPRYGPVGQKILLADDDRAIVTSDLHRLLDEVELTHPAARMVAAGAVEQKTTIGDGSLAVALLTGALAARARDLLEESFHRATIGSGYHRAGEVAIDEVDACARPVESPDDPTIAGVARAGLASLVTEGEPGVLDAVLETARLLHTEVSTTRTLGLDDVEFTHRHRNGGSVELLRGAVLDESPVSETTPTDIEDAAIAVIGGGRKAGSGIEERTPRRQGGEPGEGRTEFALDAETADDVMALHSREREQVDEQIETIIEAGTDVVFCNMGISKTAQGRLRTAGIPAFRGLTSGRSRLVARATGARRVMHLAELTASDLGRAGRFRVVSDGDGTDYVRLEDCPHGEVATLLLPDVVAESRAELERDLRASVVTVLDVLQGEPVVPGGGTTEVALARTVRDAARGTDDRTALVMDAFADALEDLPRALIRNAGADPLDLLPALRTGETARTVDVATGDVVSVTPETPHHPASVFRGMIGTATDLAVQLTRIDAVLSATDDDEDTVEDVDFSPNVDTA